MANYWLLQAIEDEFYETYVNLWFDNPELLCERLQDGKVGLEIDRAVLFEKVVERVEKDGSFPTQAEKLFFSFKNGKRKLYFHLFDLCRDAVFNRIRRTDPAAWEQWKSRWKTYAPVNTSVYLGIDLASKEDNG